MHEGRFIGMLSKDNQEEQFFFLQQQTYLIVASFAIQERTGVAAIGTIPVTQEALELKIMNSGDIAANNCSGLQRKLQSKEISVSGRIANASPSRYNIIGNQNLLNTNDDVIIQTLNSLVNNLIIVEGTLLEIVVEGDMEFCAISNITSVKKYLDR
jgi:hypothetical protein